MTAVENGSFLANFTTSDPLSSLADGDRLYDFSLNVYNSTGQVVYSGSSDTNDFANPNGDYLYVEEDASENNSISLGFFVGKQTLAVTFSSPLAVNEPVIPTAPSNNNSSKFIYRTPAFHSPTENNPTPPDSYNTCTVVSGSITQSPVTITNLVWDAGPNGNPDYATRRGVDFSYAVNGGIPANLTIPIQFYWATGRDFADIISSTENSSGYQPDSVNINPISGFHGFDTSEDYTAGNDPARWGTPPANAAYVLAVIDPHSLLGETDDPTMANGRLTSLSLPNSIADVLQGSVNAYTTSLNGSTYPVQENANFTPGFKTGSSMPLSEAEVYLGIDHFNWVQSYIDPTNIKKFYLTNYSYNKRLIYDANANLVEYMDGSFPPIQSLAAEPVIDPVEQNASLNPDQYITVVSVINNFFVSVVSADSDQYRYFYNEPLAPLSDPYLQNGNASIIKSIAQEEHSTSLMFADNPQTAAQSFPFTHGEYVTFQTELVGVNYNETTYNEYNNQGYKVAFTWNSNNIYDGETYSGGGVSDPTLYAGDITTVPSVGGGVFGSRMIDSFNASSDSPHLAAIGNQTMQLGQTLTLTLKGDFNYSQHNTTLFRLGGASTASASLDSKSGSFNFTPKSIGSYVFYFSAYNADGATESEKVIVSVVNDPNHLPPIVTTSSNGLATVGSNFTQSGSFQDTTGTAPFTATVDYGDGSAVQPLTLNSNNSFALSHVFAIPGSYGVSVSVTDSSGLTGTARFSVSVAQPVSSLPPITAPVLPVVSIGPYAYTSTWTAYTGIGSIQDTSTAVPFTVAVNYGDGSPPQFLPVIGTDQFKLSHVYSSAGNYAVTVNVSDADGFFGSTQAEVSVTPPISGFGSVADAFVSSLYRDVLARYPEYSGLRFWAKELVSHVKTTTIVEAFFHSMERRTLTREHLVPKINPRQALADANRAAVRVEKRV